MSPKELRDAFKRLERIAPQIERGEDDRPEILLSRSRRATASRR
jgi:hypothetical protein